MTNAERRTLNVAISMLKSLCDPKDTQCGVDPRAKEELRPYVQSWVLPRLEVIAKPREERDPSDVVYLKTYAQYR